MKTKIQVYEVAYWNHKPDEMPDNLNSAQLMLVNATSEREAETQVKALVNGEHFRICQAVPAVVDGVLKTQFYIGTVNVGTNLKDIAKEMMTKKVVHEDETEYTIIFKDAFILLEDELVPFEIGVATAAEAKTAEDVTLNILKTSIVVVNDGLNQHLYRTIL
jgi:hypothetical protein